MSHPLADRTVALAETRQIEDLAGMLEKEGATPVRVPMVAILDAPDPAPVVAWLRELAGGKFGTVVFMTGEGFRRLLAVADAHDLRQPVIDALGMANIIARGPKPGQALKAVGLKPTKTADAPTTAGLVATLAREPLTGVTVGVQLHGQDDNPPLTDAVTAGGGTPVAVKPYRYAPAADADKVADLIRDMAAGTVDALVITSTPQVERLVEVAAARGLADDLRAGLAATCVAAVGPVAADTLKQHGFRVDIMPEQGWQMKNLVVHLKRELDAKKPR